MTISRLATLLLSLPIAVLLIAPRPSIAEEDHLVGMVVKDLDMVQPGPGFTLQTAEGTQTCELKKAKFRLLQAQKNGGDDPNGGPAGEFVCYKAKCTGTFAAGTTSADQFGTHSLQAKKTQLVCTPVDRPVCGDNDLDPGETCDGTQLGACTAFCLPNCTCGPPCEATTGGFCWFFGADGDSCDTVCSGVGGTYDPATASYAGSGGSDANCQNVLLALGSTATFATGGICSIGLGCASAGSFDLRCPTPATTAAAAGAGFRRPCACQ